MSNALYFACVLSLRILVIVAPDSCFRLACLLSDFYVWRILFSPPLDNQHEEKQPNILKSF